MFDLNALEQTALDILDFDGEVSDTLAEFRRAWGEQVPALMNERFDAVCLQYRTLPHRQGMQALGQELTAWGWGLYDFDQEDEFSFVLIPEAQRDAFEAQCRRSGHYFKQMKQPRRKWGQPAKEQDPGKRMPCMERPLSFPEGERYDIRSIAGDHLYGRWTTMDDDSPPSEWKGSFVVDLRRDPLVPIKVKPRQLSSLLYHRELGLYAALHRSLAGTMWSVRWGKDPVQMADWGGAPTSLKSEQALYWLGNTLYCGGRMGGFGVTLNEQGMEHFERIGAGENEAPWHFAADGCGRAYLIRENRGSREKEVLSVDTMERVCSVSGYDKLENSVPLPGTDKLVTIHETWSGYGETRGDLLELDLKTQFCRLAPLPGMGEHLKIYPFWKEWLLIKAGAEDNRKDLAQLWNRETGEVLRVRPGMFGLDRLDGIAALTDGSVALWLTRRGAGPVLCYPEDFWGFVRTANKPKKLGAWREYPNRYPNISNQLPPLNSDRVFAVWEDRLEVCGWTLTPPFPVESVTAVLGEAKIVTRQGAMGASPVARHPAVETLYIWDAYSLMGYLDEAGGCIRSFALCLKPHARVLTERPFDGAILVGGRVYNDVDTHWNICGLLDQIQVGDLCVTTCLESRGVQKVMMWYWKRHLEVSYCPAGAGWAYDPPQINEPVLQFQNTNFKLAVMQELMFEQELLDPQLQICEFASSYPRRRIDLEYEGKALPITEALLWCKSYPIPARYGVMVTELRMHPQNGLYQNLAPNWDGEDDLFSISGELSEEELRQFPNLKRARLLSSEQDKLGAVFARCGVETAFYPAELPRSKSGTQKYRLPAVDEPVLTFRYLTFKLAVMQVLMYEKHLLKPEFDIYEFAEEYDGRDIDPEDEGYDDLIPEALDWFWRYPIPARLAPEVTEISMDGGDDINCQLAPQWDGEDDLFSLNGLEEAEVRQFPNLKRASIFTSNERAVVPVLRKCGVEVINAYDVPFDMDKECPASGLWDKRPEADGPAK